MKLTTIAVSAGFILIVATLLNIGQLYLMAGMLAAIPVVCAWVGRRQRGGLSATRTVPETAVAGETVLATLELTNLDRWPKPHLLVGDRLPPWVVNEDAAALSVDGIGSHPTPDTRHPTPQPEGGVAVPARAGSAVAGIPISLDASGTGRVSYHLRPEKRGAFQIGPIEVTAADPLGIFQFKSELPVASSLVVYPSPVPLPWFFLPGGNPFGASPLHSAEMRGEGSEFYGIREYQPGDPLRRVHWRSSARMGRLAVVEYEHDVSVDVTIVLDTRKGSEVGYGKESTLEYGVTVAASIAHLAASNNDIVRLLVPGYAEWREPGLRGLEARQLAMDVLARVQADQPVSVAETLNAHAGVFRRDAFVAVITSVWSDDLLAAIAGLTDRGMKVAAIFVDPASFAGGAGQRPTTDDRRPTPGRREDGKAETRQLTYAESLAAVGAQAYIIRRGLPLAEQFL